MAPQSQGQDSAATHHMPLRQGHELCSVPGWKYLPERLTLWVGPPNGSEQEPLEGNSRHQGRLWATGPSETPSWSRGCQVPAPSARGQAQKSPHQKLKEAEKVGGWEEGQASGLQTDTSES